MLLSPPTVGTGMPGGEVELTADRRPTPVELVQTLRTARESTS
jgi:hypothetical protein